MLSTVKVATRSQAGLEARMNDGEQSMKAKASPRAAAYNAGAIGWLYRSISLSGIAMAVGGVITELYLTGEMKNGLWPVAEVFPALMAGEASAWTTLGIWILLVGPGLALVAMFVSGVRRRSWPAVVLSSVVLLIIILAIPILNWVERGGV